jgi:predicted phage gp36 major capsid-like protein
LWCRSWEQLADLNAQQSVAVIDETAAALATIPGGADLNTVNQVFMVCTTTPFWQGVRPRVRRRVVEASKLVSDSLRSSIQSQPKSQRQGGVADCGPQKSIEMVG